MTLKEIDYFKNRHCKFKLKSGKEVYGVIWVDDPGSGELFFSSPSEREIYEAAKVANDFETIEKLRYSISVDEIIGAEML